MAKYINADTYEQCLVENDWDIDTEEYSTVGIFELLHDMPTADVVERSEINKAIDELIKEIEENHLNVIDYADGEWIVKDFVYGAIDRLKEKIALDKR